MLKYQGPAVVSGCAALVDGLDIATTVLCMLTDRLSIYDA